MITCASCGETNQDHYRFCLGCGASLAIQPSADPPQDASAPSPDPAPAPSSALPSVPLQSPRQMTTGWGPILSAHLFPLLFGGIWAAVGGVIFLVFSVIGFLALPLMMLFSLLPLLFLVIGSAILFYGVRSASRDRDLLLHGTRVMGTIVDSRLDGTVKVNNQPSTRIEYTYRDLHGSEHSGMERIFDKGLIQALEPGTELPILISPSDPSSSVLPAARDVRFVMPAPVEDNRPERLLTKGSPAPPASWATPLPLVSSLDPAPLSLWDRFVGASDGVVPMGAVTLEGARLTTPGASVDLEAPFVTSITVWPLALDQAEVAVSLRNRGAPPTDPSVTVKARLDQAQISGHLPVQQEAGAWLTTDHFALLWEHLCYHASLHGDDLRRNLQTSEQHTHQVHVAEPATVAQRA